MRPCLLCCLFLLCSLVLMNAQFTQMDLGIPVFQYGFIAPGDYDNDGDLDLFILGNSTLYQATLYRNDGNWQFTPSGIAFPAFSRGCAAWGDFDRDGWLDLAVSGAVSPVAYAANFKLYRNLQGQDFEELPFVLPGIQRSHHSWVDYDNDGDWDLVFQGAVWSMDGTDIQTGVVRNLGASQFEVASLNVTPIFNGELRSADYNRDGELDLASSGWYELPDHNFGYTTRVYRNQGDGSWVNVLSPGLVGGSGMDWFDCDNDGDLDLVFCGLNSSNQQSTRIMLNNGGGGFTLSPATLPGVWMGDLACADYDNDGDSDIFLCGRDSSSHSLAVLMRNEGDGIFIPSNDDFTTVKESQVCWADLDNDGDLDLAYLGEESLPPVIGDRIRFYRNDTNAYNWPPACPDVSYSPDTGFTFTPSADDTTPPHCLSYELRIGTTPGGGEILMPQSHPATGYRRIPESGRSSFARHRLEPGTYYVSSQAIDAGFRGSAWSPEITLQVGVAADDPLAPSASLQLRASPNPFRDRSCISFQIVKTAPTTLRIYDLRGRKVATLLSETLPPGAHEVFWPGSELRASLGSGIYLARLTSGTDTQTRRLFLTR
ncbi:MAG TPA: T9SS type A sorting domain-containing protein, partial [Candidatus Syntrophosphaera sp.]|nr:T9SS type A sorting domain-containing protein [Candidatus Syntrophosphaera sp.]